MPQVYQRQLSLGEINEQKRRAALEAERDRKRKPQYRGRSMSNRPLVAFRKTEYTDYSADNSW